MGPRPTQTLAGGNPASKDGKINVRWGWDVIQNSSKSYQKVFLWTCSLSNKNSPDSIYRSFSECPFPRNGKQVLLPSCPTLKIQASSQCPTSRPWVARAQLSATFRGDVSQNFHILAPSPSNEQWPFSPFFLLGGKRIPTLSSQNSIDSWRTNWDWQRGWYYLECFFN